MCQYLPKICYAHPCSVYSTQSKIVDAWEKDTTVGSPGWMLMCNSLVLTGLHKQLTILVYPQVQKREAHESNLLASRIKTKRWTVTLLQEAATWQWLRKGLWMEVRENWFVSGGERALEVFREWLILRDDTVPGVDKGVSWQSRGRRRSRIWEATDGAAAKKKAGWGWREDASQCHRLNDSVAGKVVPKHEEKEVVQHEGGLYQRLNQSEGERLGISQDVPRPLSPWGEM